jgi:hypothetical protein
MDTATLVARWTLGGTLALFAGLAAVAEPLVPLRPSVPAPMLAAPVAPLHIAVSPIAAPALAPPSRPAAMVREAPPEVRTGASLRPVARGVFIPPARWDHRPHGEEWTLAALRAMDTTRRDLRDIVPADIAAWCPGYETAPEPLRAAFWVATISALARYESNHDPQAVGGGGAWFGLLQISPATARGYGCEADSGSELTDGEANVACAVRIMARTVARDGVVAAGGGGLAADWGPMSREAPREAIRQWVRDQPYCEVQTAVATALRPLARPGGVPIRLAAR